MSKFQHLTLENRLTIQEMLKERCSFKEIAKKINKHCTTISKEIQNHKIFKQTGSYGRNFNNCKRRFTCKRASVCANQKCNFKYCKFCGRCINFCEDYVQETCQLRDKPPYVCNGCTNRNKCTLEKSFYEAISAQNEYEEVRTESRSGINLDEQTITYLDNLISPLILKGQAIHHIYATNIDAIMCCEKSIYNYVDYNLFSARNIDLPRRVKFRPRKNKQNNYKVDKKCRIGRTYEDFLKYMEENPDTPIVQMDTVEGTQGGKVLLTIHFLESELMLSFLRDANTAKSVIDIFNDLYEKLGQADFKKLVPVILTDNGSEFSDPLKIEFDAEQSRRTRIFYCDRAAPYQKGALENNHSMLRRVIPKGKSMDNLTQQDIELMMNHINSYKRKKLNDRCPISVFSFLFGSEILQKLAIEHIPAKEIVLLPTLLKR
ncbi:MAG: IS30 family transposase [Firmicutes bacterium]|nr:IS30 family transposase [Bacillota bacterium]